MQNDIKELQLIIYQFSCPIVNEIFDKNEVEILKKEILSLRLENFILKTKLNEKATNNKR